MIQTLRSTIAEIGPLLALQQVRPVTDAVSAIEAPRHFNTDLITGFAIGALLLAITGIYAVIAFSVSQRTQEIAIRMTLGAQRASIAKLVLVSGAKLALLGCGLGVLRSLAVSRLVSSFLFGVLICAAIESDDDVKPFASGFLDVESRHLVFDLRNSLVSCQSPMSSIRVAPTNRVNTKFSGLVRGDDVAYAEVSSHRCPPHEHDDTKGYWVP